MEQMKSASGWTNIKKKYQNGSIKASKLESIKFILEKNSFSFVITVCRLSSEVAMGIKAAPTIANLKMSC